jgi:hypothetical protein
MNKTMYVRGVLVHSNAFKAATSAQSNMLTAEEGLAAGLISKTIDSFIEANGDHPACVTCFEGVAIAWPFDPHHQEAFTFPC